MIDVEKIEDGLITAIKRAITSLKTVDTYEAEYDDAAPQRLLALSPFCLIYYGGLVPVDGERFQDGEIGICKQEFHFFFGSHSLRSKREGQLGCYGILKSLRELLNGNGVEVEGGDSTPEFRLDEERFLSSQHGLIVYRAVYSIYQL